MSQESLDVAAEKDRESTMAEVMSGDLDRKIARFREQGWAPLGVVERAIVIAYAETGNPQAVAEVTKLDVMTVRKYLRDPLVRAAISDVQDAVLANSLINQGRVREMMLETYEKAQGREKVFVAVDGVITEQYLTNLPVAKGVAEWFGKELGMTATDKQKTAGVVVNISFDRVKSGHTVDASAQVVESLPDPGEIDD